MKKREIILVTAMMYVLCSGCSKTQQNNIAVTTTASYNEIMKTENDNPTLGLLICKDMDKVEAQYALESTSQPLGISSYELSKLIPEEFKGSLPTIEEIEAELKD